MKEPETHDDDIIHGALDLSPACRQVIAHPLFARLARISQLGSLRRIYPAASHTRYEHSLGTAHLSRIAVDAVAWHQPALEVTPRERLWVEIAGLCHDLGHGPLSHEFESFYKHVQTAERRCAVRDASDRTRRKKKKHDEKNTRHDEKTIETKNDRDDDPTNDERFAREPQSTKRRCVTHETLSVILTKRLLESLPDLFDAQDIAAVTWLIDPRRLPRPSFVRQERDWLSDIVHNRTHGLDTDKMDYLLRDAARLGVDGRYDIFRMDVRCALRNARVTSVDGRPTFVFHMDQSLELGDLCWARQSMHQAFYCHPAVMPLKETVSEYLRDRDIRHCRCAPDDSPPKEDEEGFVLVERKRSRGRRRSSAKMSSLRRRKRAAATVEDESSSQPDSKHKSDGRKLRKGDGRERQERQKADRRTKCDGDHRTDGRDGRRAQQGRTLAVLHDVVRGLLLDDPHDVHHRHALSMWENVDDAMLETAIELQLCARCQPDRARFVYLGLTTDRIVRPADGARLQDVLPPYLAMHRFAYPSLRYISPAHLSDEALSLGEPPTSGAERGGARAKATPRDRLHFVRWNLFVEKQAPQHVMPKLCFYEPHYTDSEPIECRCRLNCDVPCFARPYIHILRRKE